MKEFNKKKFIYVLGISGLIFIILLFWFMYYFTIASKIEVIVWFFSGVVALSFLCILIYKRLSVLNPNIENNNIYNKKTITWIILIIISLFWFFYLIYDSFEENKKEKEIQITEQVYLNYDNSKWKIAESDKEMFEIFLFSWRKKPQIADILLMDNNDKSVSENMEYSKKLISTSWWKIVSSKELKINWIDYYVISYILFIDNKKFYNSSFTTLSPNKKKVIVLKIAWIDKNSIDENSIDENLNDFMERIIIK